MPLALPPRAERSIAVNIEDALSPPLAITRLIDHSGEDQSCEVGAEEAAADGLDFGFFISRRKCVFGDGPDFGALRAAGARRRTSFSRSKESFDSRSSLLAMSRRVKS